MIPSICRRGIPEEKILPVGIPVDESFMESIPQAEAREKLSLDPKQFTVLMSAGGMGFTGLISAAQDIDQLDDVQIVAVCGTNKKLQARMRENQFRNTVHVLGFVHNMSEYMDACDVFITKPGGLSTSEAIAKRKPLILTRPMPGVENMNLVFLVNNSLAVHANQYQPICEVIMQLRQNDRKLEEMAGAQAQWGKGDSARKLGEFIEGLV
jgi:processive 1,2-diacylglycerol beta-glucosyltransferase